MSLMAVYCPIIQLNYIVMNIHEKINHRVNCAQVVQYAINPDTCKLRYLVSYDEEKVFPFDRYSFSYQ